MGLCSSVDTHQLLKDLAKAIQAGDVKAVNELLDEDISLTVEGLVDMGGQDGRTPLVLAAENVQKGDFLAVCESLIQHGADVNKACGPGTSRGDTPLVISCKRGKLGVVKLFLSKGADPQKADRINGESPMHWAATYGHIEIIEALLHKGAYLNGKDDYGRTPLQRAAVNGEVKAVQYLLSKGANFAHRDNNKEDIFMAVARTLELCDTSEIKSLECVADILQKHSLANQA
jgi:ankyrin repeat protein